MHTTEPRQAPALKRCPLASRSFSFPFPLENQARDIGVSSEAIKRCLHFQNHILQRAGEGEIFNCPIFKRKNRRNFLSPTPPTPPARKKTKPSNNKGSLVRRKQSMRRKQWTQAGPGRAAGLPADFKTED